MCKQCWIDAGQPNIANERVFQCVDLIRDVYTFSSSGGNLHCQLDDYNLGDEFFDTDAHVIYLDVSPEQFEAEKKCYSAMKNMSEQERYAAVALYDSYWEAEK